MSNSLQNQLCVWMNQFERWYRNVNKSQLFGILTPLLIIGSAWLYKSIYPTHASFMYFMLQRKLRFLSNYRQSYQIGDGRERRCLEFVMTNSQKGDAKGVLAAIDKFAWTQDWLMNIGDDKGKVLTDAVIKKKPKYALEVGAFIGYSAIRIAMDLPPDSHLISVEISEDNAAIASEMIKQAGLSGKVTIVVGTVTTALKNFVSTSSISQFDLVFLDHIKDAYLSDLKYLLEENLIAKYGVIVADNVLYPGAPDYREFVNSSSRLKTVEYKINLEYMRNIPDIVTVSELVA